MSESPIATIRNAASLVLVREARRRTQILMGRRTATAVFMPNKFVFPGGAVEPQDYTGLQSDDATCINFGKLGQDADEGLASALVNCAMRETWEESGIRILPAAARRHARFGAEELADNHAIEQSLVASRVTFILRAITPPGYIRRFDTRFFLANCESTFIDGAVPEPESSSSELQDLKWMGFDQALKLDTPYITGVVLRRAQALVAEGSDSANVPFYFTADGVHRRETL